MEEGLAECQGGHDEDLELGNKMLSSKSTGKHSTKPVGPGSAVVRIFPVSVPWASASSCGSTTASEIINLQRALATTLIPTIPPRQMLAPVVCFDHLDGEFVIQVGVTPPTSNVPFCTAVTNPWLTPGCNMNMTPSHSHSLQKMLSKPFKIFNVDDIPEPKSKGGLTDGMVSMS